MAEIREATVADANAVVAMGHFMHAESPRFRHATYSEEACLRTFNSLVEADFGTVLVACDGAELVGMMAGFAMPAFFSGGVSASELLLYVVPHRRGGSLAPRLVWAFEQWAQGRGAAEIVVGVSTEINVDQTENFYRRMGYTPTGRTLLKRCAGTQPAESGA